MVVLFKGDSTRITGKTIKIQLPQGDFKNVRFIFDFMSTIRVWTKPQSGGVLDVDYSAKETSLFPLGTFFGNLIAETIDGQDRCLVSRPRIMVSDFIGDVHGEGKTIRIGENMFHDLSNLQQLADNATQREMREMINELVSVIKGEK